MSRRIWKLQDYVAHTGRVNCARFGEKSGQVLATGGDDKRVNIWKVGKPNAMMSLTGHTSSVECLVFDKQEEVLIVGCGGGSMQVWNLEYRKMNGTLAGHRTACAAVEFHPYGEFFASGSADTNLKIWDLRRKSCIQTYSGHTGAISTIRFSPHGRWVASGGQDGQVKLWDLTAGKLMKDLDMHKGLITSLAFHPKEYSLATSSSDRTVKLWSLETFKVVGSTDLGSSPVQAVKFYVEEQAVMSASQDALRIYPSDNLLSPSDVMEAEWRGLQDMRLCYPEDKLLAVTTDGSQLGLWVADLQKRESISGKGSQGRLHAVKQGAGSGSGGYSKIHAPRRADAEDTAPTPTPPVSRESVERPRSNSIEEARGITPKLAVQTKDDEAQARDARLDRFSLRTSPKSHSPTGGHNPSRQLPSPGLEAKARNGPASEVHARRDIQSDYLLPASRLSPASSPTRAPVLGDDRSFGGPTAPSRPSLETISQLSSKHTKQIGVLQRRLEQAHRLRVLWDRGSISDLGATLNMPQDHAVFCDFLRAIMKRELQVALNLDACQILLPLVRDLLSSKYTDFVIIGLQFVDVLLKQFGTLISDTRKNCAKIPERHLDPPAEERLRKCNVCFDNFKEIYREMPNSPSGGRFSDLKASLHEFLHAR